MKRSWMVLLLLVGVAVPAASHAQVSAYGEVSAAKYFALSPATQDYLYGATTGVLIDGPHLGHRVLLTADIQGRFVGGGNGKRSDSVSVGPRFWFPLHHGRISPFAEFLVGFSRFNNGLGTSSTDSMIQINGGVAKQLTPRLDAVADYSYAQFYYGGGAYNPKTFSLGVIYHFTKR
jgi:hypothetical protein